MKIVVANQAEKELVKKFITAMTDLEIYDELHAIDNNCLEEECFFDDCNELTFLESGLMNTDIAIDESCHEFGIENDSVIVGVCKHCKIVTHGRGEYADDNLTYTEYLKLNSKEEQENWSCEDCFNKNQ